MDEVYPAANLDAWALSTCR